MLVSYENYSLGVFFGVFFGVCVCACETGSLYTLGGPRNCNPRPTASHENSSFVFRDNARPTSGTSRITEAKNRIADSRRTSEGPAPGSPQTAPGECGESRLLVSPNDHTARSFSATGTGVR